MAMVFASMLRADGWSYRFVLAPNREERFFRKDIPSILQFEGWLIQVADPKEPSRVIYVSFEHPLLAFGEVPWVHLGVDALSLDLESGTSTVIKVPQSPAETNATQRQWGVDLTEEGDAHVERTSDWSGQPAFQVRAQLYREGKQEWEKEIRNEYQKLDPPAEIESVSWENEEKSDVHLVGKLRFSRNALASTLPGGRLEISPLAMLGHHNPFTSDVRNDPIYFPYPYLDDDVIRVAPPAGFVIDALPKPTEIQTEAGRYVVHIEKGDSNTVLIRREFEIRRFAAAPNLYPAYRSLFESAARGDSSVSLVFKRAASSPGKAF